MATLSEINSPAYLTKIRKQAEARLAPTRDIALKQIGLEEVGVGQLETQAKREAANLTRILEENAKNASGGLQERYNELGLLQSGMTAAGLGDIQKDLFRGKKETEQDKASRLAALALQRSGIGLKRAETQQNYLGGVNDIVRQLIETARQDAMAREAASRARASAASTGFGSGTSQLLNALFNPPTKAAPKPKAGAASSQQFAKNYRLSNGQLDINRIAQDIIPQIADLSTTKQVKALKEFGFSTKGEIGDILNGAFNPGPTEFQQKNYIDGGLGDFSWFGKLFR